MSSGAEGGRDLSPEPFIELAENLPSSQNVGETILRRIVSGLFFSLFNYWAWRRLNSGARGKGASAGQVLARRVLP